MDELHDDGAWIEAISLFRHVWAGDCVGGMRLLDVVSREVVNDLGGSLAAQRVVGPVVIVVMQPPRIPPRTGGLTVVGVGVSPLGHQRPVEPLDLAIGLRPIRPGVLMPDALSIQHLVEQP